MALWSALLVENLSSMSLKTGLWSVESQGIFIILISGNLEINSHSFLFSNIFPVYTSLIAI